MDPMTVFLNSLAKSVGEKMVSEAFELLREIIRLKQEQVKLLQAIDLKVDSLLQGPFEMGRRQLGLALSAWRDKADRNHLLTGARDSFLLAISQDPEPLRRSLASLHLVCVWLAMGSRIDAERSLREAHLDALSAIAMDRPREPSTGIEHLVQRIFGSQEPVEGALAGLARAAEIAQYSNGLARARRAWGAPVQQAPLVWGKFGISLGGEGGGLHLDYLRAWLKDHTR
jgi:hypothetical protein